MAVHTSVIKRARQNTKARQRNRSWKSRIKTQQKRIEGALTEKDTGALESLYREYCSLVDKAASRKIFHKNNAARKKTKMQMRIKIAGSSPASPAAKADTSPVKEEKSAAAEKKAKASSSKKAAAPKKPKEPKEEPSSAEEEASTAEDAGQ